MILLASTSDLIRVITSAAVTTDVHASFVDLNGSTVTPGRTNTPITTAATTTVVASPGASTYRTLKTLTIRNRHATTAQAVTVVHTDGTNAMELFEVTLLAGYCLHYHEGAGFWVTDTFGRQLSGEGTGGTGAAVNATNFVVLAADVTSNSTANAITDVTGLQFPVVAGETYHFEFVIDYTAAATTTGSRWAINGPATTRLAYTSEYALTATSKTTNNLSAYDTPAASNATSSATTGNIATIWGLITPSANDNVVARFASEVASSAIVAKAGSLVKWYRTL